MSGKKVGKVLHFFEKPSVAVMEISRSLKSGDKIYVMGATTDFKQVVDSMQIEHEKISFANKGQLIGLKVIEKVRKNDYVYLC